MSNAIVPANQPTPAAAGWYPVNVDRQRYWDGRGWTNQYAPIVSQPHLAPRPAGDFVTTNARTSTVEVVFAWVLTVLTLGYMLPWAIAASRGKSNSLAVGLVNFLLGWTFVGWVVALVMACGAHQTFVVRR